MKEFMPLMTTTTRTIKNNKYNNIPWHIHIINEFEDFERDKDKIITRTTEERSSYVK